ncbi:hypothetical protein A3752_18610 [Oleiphilus sp. HI0081]|uniref:DUF6316 family protein n=1 Tax=unclassified Oleiphilus TaxID=2631174 RepID=UPI0007C2E559|nr:MULTISPECIES: DUF6316 family protein [unclassified Oleiphilus]KZZ12485.1 hypothetical protein A3749_06240 [Oleiphilus sp. HI0078]KZZ29646.1 hypothetical protein A3752_18610 [Oleiphilus sp. HI0081]KZY38794.1 hypothetical protein A3729_25680 [Oleiphilus sp. HI0043]KZY39893.1 hypothetical protein A3729_02120 [Oleiphilus sp. HI0043]KZZ68935.1 hypothetical protein A3763_13355 [Oleiphilus sp. HI0128]
MNEQADLSHRTGEQGEIPFRSSRFFSVGNKWYFSTREGFDSGPYANKERARDSLQSFLKIINKLPTPYTKETAH